MATRKPKVLTDGMEPAPAPAVKKAAKKTAAKAAKTAAATKPAAKKTARKGKPQLAAEPVLELTNESAHEQPAPEAVVLPGPSDLREEITRQAFLYWVDRRYAPGDPVADWLRAEHEVLRRYGLR